MAHKNKVIGVDEMKMAEASVISTYIELLDELLLDVFDGDFGTSDDVMVSDLSSVYDFTLFEDEAVEARQKILKLWGIDITQIPDGNLVELFRCVEAIRSIGKQN